MNAHGFPCGNFAVAGSCSPGGRLFAVLQHNPGELGQHLVRNSGGQIWFKRRMGGDYDFPRHPLCAVRDEECRYRRVHHQWPVVEMELSDPRLGPLTFTVTAFAPLQAGDGGAVSGLRALLARVVIHNRGTDSVDGVTVEFQHEHAVNTDWPVSWFDSRKSCRAPSDLRIAAGQSETFWLVLTQHDKNWLQAADDGGDLARDVASRAESLLESTRDVARRLPTSGEPDLDAYLRWNATAAVSLTKLTCRGEVLTMGYSELNQRDSFWTSMLHLLLWPELESRMIEESIAAQLPNGKIPTCILPTIDREVDIDINAYFVLRMTRYLATYSDVALARRWWPSAGKALEFLASLDDEKIGLPYQRTFWGDWKDVKGVTERTYAPHACLITVAAYQQGAALAKLAGEAAACDTWTKMAKRAKQQIDRPFAEGGLWNGRFYQQRWRDGRDDGVLLQDQVLAALFGVIDSERLASIWSALDAHSRGVFGITETWPHYPESFGYRPGHYHNGGVWPWLSYADAWARLSKGRREDGIDLLRKVAWADLELGQDFSPHEYIASDTGENCGPPVQGWTASFVGAIAWGWKGEGMPRLTMGNGNVRCNTGTNDE
jgi:hypothetical protein